jgi:hypothetical protein
MNRPRSPTTLFLFAVLGVLQSCASPLEKIKVESTAFVNADPNVAETGRSLPVFVYVLKKRGQFMEAKRSAVWPVEDGTPPESLRDDCLMMGYKLVEPAPRDPGRLTVDIPLTRLQDDPQDKRELCVAIVANYTVYEPDPSMSYQPKQRQCLPLDRIRCSDATFRLGKDAIEPLPRP